MAVVVHHRRRHYNRDRNSLHVCRRPATFNADYTDDNNPAASSSPTTRPPPNGSPPTSRITHNGALSPTPVKPTTPTASQSGRPSNSASPTIAYTCSFCYSTVTSSPSPLPTSSRQSSTRSDTRASPRCCLRCPCGSLHSASPWPSRSMPRGRTSAHGTL